MPGRRAEPAPIDVRLCRRCQVSEPAITVRTEPLCTACFSKYVLTKIVKRMESFRVRHVDIGMERVLLLPLSFGACSMALLHALSQHLKGQAEKTRRTGYRLHVLHVDCAITKSSASLADKVRERYPEHTFSTVPLPDVLSSDGVKELFQQSSLSEGQDGADDEARLESLFSTLDSPTSRHDVKQILMRKLVVSFAKASSCEAILWGDSTTRLAERTLAETAKGRGASLPWILTDDDTLHGIPSHYPMRDLLSKEIAAFASMVQPPLDELIAEEVARPAVSTKNTTIDDLMKQYFESVEQEYPSIVANVVKTTAKLQTTLPREIEQQCELCDIPLDGQAPEQSRLCYGCLRTLPQVAT